MNLSLRDPFQNDFPEHVEETLQHGVARCVAFNRRGTLLAAGCADGVVVIWDFQTRGVVKELQEAAHRSPIASLQWSKNGFHLLAATSTGCRVVLWDVLSGSPVVAHTLPSPVLLARLSPCGSLALASCLSSAPLLIRLADGRRQEVPCTLAALRQRQQPPQGQQADAAEGPASPPSAKSASPPEQRGSGKRGARASSAKGRGRGSGRGGQPKGQAAPLKASDSLTSSAPVPALFSRSGSAIIVGSAGGHLLLMDAKELREVAVAVVPGGACVRQLAMSRDGRFLLTNSTDRVLRVFHVALEEEGEEGEGEEEEAGELAGQKVRRRVGEEPRGAVRAVAEAAGRALPSGVLQGSGEAGANEGQQDGREREGEQEGGKGRQGESGGLLMVSQPSEQRSRGLLPESSPQEAPHSAAIRPCATWRPRRVCSARVALLREFQEVVDRLHWRAACFSGDGEFVVAGPAAAAHTGGGGQRLHIWSRAFGQLVRIAEGPREGALVDLAAHPTNRHAVTVSAEGAVLVWAQSYRESWTAFEPSFRELEENEEYVEREDEFDEERDPALEPHQPLSPPAEAEAADVDIETVERVAVLSDSDDSSQALLFLPVHPVGGVGREGEGEEGEEEVQGGLSKDPAEAGDAAEGQGRAGEAEDSTATEGEGKRRRKLSGRLEEYLAERMAGGGGRGGRGRGGKAERGRGRGKRPGAKNGEQARRAAEGESALLSQAQA